MTTKGPLPPSREFHPNSTPRPPPLSVSTCGVTFFFPRFDGSARTRKVRVMPSDPTGEVERSRSLVRTISKLFCPSPLFLSLLILSDLELFFFPFFFSFKGEGFLFFFLYFYFIFVSLWIPWEKLEILCKGNDLSIFINFINSIVAS